MSFELKHRDLLGRIGRLKTRRGIIETPALLPVVNPLYQTVSPRRMLEEFRCSALFTNAYIVKKRFGDEPGLDIHRLLGYDGVVATDSGAYQILVYGGVETTPEEIVTYQKRIGSDMAVILDHPTGWNVPREKAEWTVERTLERARAAQPLIEGDDILWFGPVQGGEHLDLVERSAREMSSMSFQVYALGSPTQVMERYLFTVLVDMIMAAKRNLPPDRPLHLFGAGHPMMFSLAVALGCDMFDSAAYALFAREERYMLPSGTERLEDLRYLPCSCPICRRHDPDDLREMLREERITALTEHNLYASMTEVDAVKQAITEGALWELLETRCRSHPRLFSSLKHLEKYRDVLEAGSPGGKAKGIFVYDYASLTRPEVTRYGRRLMDNFAPPSGSRLLLLPAPDARPYDTAPQYMRLRERLEESGASLPSLHVCFYASPFGIIPAELAETFPLSQFEAAEPMGREVLEFTARGVERYVASKNYEAVILIRGLSELDALVEESCRRVLEVRGIPLMVKADGDPWSAESMDRLMLMMEEETRD